MLPPDRLPEGWSELSFAEVDSTNAEAMRQAAAGARGPLWITAGRQSLGRGRAGRSWSTDTGNLAASLLFAPRCEPAALAQLSLVAGIAAHDAISAALPAVGRGNVRLKWPNDVLIGMDKVCGILVESSIMGAGPVAVIGTGINVADQPVLADRQATSLAANGAEASVADVALNLAWALSRWLSVWANAAGLAPIREAWLARASALGTPMSVHAGTRKVAGTFAGLAVDGTLLLDDEHGERLGFNFGDVALGGTKV
jgi:BirA family biotin operon repressor/biotin-[acetyl-CoA-carboxylase] ligase